MMGCGGGSGDNTTTTTDTTAPVIAEVTAVTTPTNDNTPNYTYSSTKAGTIMEVPVLQAPLLQPLTIIQSLYSLPAELIT